MAFGSGIGYWHWSLALVIGIGHWHWSLALALALGMDGRQNFIDGLHTIAAAAAGSCTGDGDRHTRRTVVDG